MNDDERLRRSYHRLLYAYPGWYRRERHHEILTTLTDAAAPRQRRPTLRDALDLLVGGLRCRLRLPRGVGPWVIATVLAGVAGLAGATAAVHLTAYPGPPTEARALAAAAVALPERPRDRPGPVVSCDYWCPEWTGGEDVVAYDGPLDRTDHALVVYGPSPERVADRVARAHARLAAAGWAVRPVSTLGNGFGQFTATGAGVRLTVTGRAATGGASHVIDIVVTKGFSRAAVVADVLGFLSGASVGWLLTAWVMQRRRRQHPGLRAATLLTSLPTLLFAALTWYGTTNVLVANVVEGGLADPNSVLLPGLPFIVFPAVTVAAGAAAIVTTALSALPTSRPPVDNRARIGA
jgi:hypothetical protein